MTSTAAAAEDLEVTRSAAPKPPDGSGAALLTWPSGSHTPPAPHPKCRTRRGRPKHTAYSSHGRRRDEHRMPMHHRTSRRPRRPLLLRRRRPRTSHRPRRIPPRRTTPMRTPDRGCVMTGSTSGARTRGTRRTRSRTDTRAVHPTSGPRSRARSATPDPTTADRNRGSRAASSTPTHHQAPQPGPANTSTTTPHSLAHGSAHHRQDPPA